MPKKVLIVARREIRKNKLINWVSEVYLQILGEYGVIPIIVPIAESTIQNLEVYTQDYDGLLMVEGGDVNPKRYNETYNEQKLEERDDIKDSIEFACCKHAITNNKPVLGICRGMHIINTMFGGTLHLDVHDANNNSVLHVHYEAYDTHRHHITIIENTPLFTWYKQTNLDVTTYHHQGIKKLGEHLIPMAISDDKLIEAIYHPHYSFVVGLQFHPERMYTEHRGNARVFESFIKSL